MAEISLIGQQLQGYNIVGKLGSGGYGTVYLGEKEDLGKKYQTAIKHISIPDQEGYEAVLQDYAYDKAAAEAHFQKIVEGITSEITTLLELSKKDNRYIVAYYDHDIQRTEDPLRFDIFLRMEYLTPLTRSLRTKGLTLGEIVRLGMNMCDALSLCHNSGVVHRDIKEANIFLSETGNFKLGDFGVAKVAMEATQTGSIKGTASYMAPEIYLHEPYDSSVDIYSLGIVLYKLLNNQRLPFMPDAPAAFTVDDKNLAETRRLKGETPPLPFNAKDRLGEIVIKACSAKEARYTRAEDLKADLQGYLKTLSNDSYDKVIIAQTADASNINDVTTQNSINSYTQTQGATMTMGAQNVRSDTSTGNINPYSDNKQKKGKGKIVLICALAALILAGGIGGYIVYLRLTDPINKFENAITENNFSDAAQLFTEELKNGDSTKLEKAEQIIIGHAGEIRTQYVNKEIEYEDALSKLQEIGKLGISDSSEVDAIIVEVNELRTSRAAFDNAQSSAAAGDWMSAVNDLRKVIQSDGNYTEAQTQLADAIRNYKDQVLSSLSDYDLNEDYNGAITTLNAGLQVVPNDADFLAKISDYEKRINDSIELAISTIIQNAKTTATTQGDYSSALNELRAMDKQYPNRDDIKEAIAGIIDLAVSAVIQEANDMVTTEADYLSALSELRIADKQYTNRSDIKDAITDIENRYIDYIFAEVDELVSKKQYDSAVTKLTALKGNVSNSEVVDTKIESVNQMRPIDLSKVVVVESSNYNYSIDPFKDPFGYQHGPSHNFSGYNSYALFNLEGKYVTLSGTLVVDSGYGSNTSKSITIFADDVLVYTYSGFTRRTEAFAFSVNLNNAKRLEIKVGGSYGTLRIENALLERN